jgi:RNA-binding protein
MKLTTKKREYLRKAAHKLEPIVRVGKDGYSDNLAQSIVEAITPRELIKVKILQNVELDKREIAEKLAEKVGAEIVGIIGRTVILFKANSEKPVISEELKSIK